MSKLDQLLEDLAYLINWLADERGGGQEHVEVAENPQAFMEQWDRFRAMVNTRKPGSASPEFLRVQDRVLKMMVAEKGLVRASDLPRLAGDERLSLWRGDICALKCDAIVNAANSALLGCWIPGHDCIDNAIHTFAGVQLRLECARIMQKQGYEEPIGQAKVTSAYNLPAKHVIHTVGPLCKQAPTTEQRGQLADCYISCLDAAAEKGLASVAFCCISTGAFGFPQEEAASIATQAVRAWLDSRRDAGEAGADMHVIFNVFTADDERCYRELLGQDASSERGEAVSE